MGKYLVKRLLLILLVLLGVTIFVFILKQASPGDPVLSLLGENASEAQKAAMRAELGLDQPVITQFFNYLGGILHGDLGLSYSTKQPVLNEILTRLPTSMIIIVIAVFIGVVVGVPAGLTSALHHNKFIDGFLVVTTMICGAIPNFCLALLMVILFSVNLHILPSYGLESPLGFIMPILAMALGPMARTASMTRTSMLEVIRQDYIRTARAKGLSQGEVTYHHVIRNGIIPVVDLVGTQIANQLGSAIIIEQIFGVPGLGKYIYDAVMLQNYPSMQGGVLVLAAVIAIINLIIDLIFIVVDPRLKTSIIGSRRKKQRKGKLNLGEVG